MPRSDLRFEAENMLEMLSVFGHRHHYPPVFAMPVQATQRERPYLVYFPSASTSAKCWPHASFSALIKQMVLRYPDHDHIVLQGIAEWESVDGIMAAQHGRANVIGMKLDDFDATVSLVKGAALLVGNDTGIRNIAIACETPTVGIFFITEVFRYWPRYGRHEAVFNQDGSVPSIEDVFAAATRVLS
ncbi:MAG: hypothetical protein A2V90_06745 [Gammaproteobacteria bacterium RBG_16_57_12]|nr:MAG: hypothetical protein A2V90_06745 [Gammaproteobacteria bacterium RBG_16_57_12]